MNIKSNTEDSIAEDMTKFGFLSAKLDDAAHAIVRVHAPWFHLCDRINELAVAAWINHPIDKAGQATTDPEPLAVRLMARAISGFEGAVILLRRGMTVEAGTLARGVYESGFWLAYIFKNAPEAIHWFKIDEDHGKKGRLVEFAALYANNEKLLPDIQASLEEVTKRLEGKPKRPLSPKQIAERANIVNYYAYYKRLCGSSAHASILSTDHYLTFFADGTVGHELGPDMEGIDRMLAFAAHAVILSLTAFSLIISDIPTQRATVELNNELTSMSHQFAVGTFE